MQQPRIVNVDVLDDKEPHVLVQRYIYPDRTFVIFRKQTSPNEVFALSPGMMIDPTLSWDITFTLFQTAEDLAEQEDLEIFALVYFDEDNQPYHRAEDVPHELSTKTKEQMCVMYDPEADRYQCANTEGSYDIDHIMAPTLDEALALGIDRLHDAVAQPNGM